MILLRHGESEFNEVYSVSGVDPGIEDPKLTERGHRQARDAAALLAEYPLRRVLASPYTRALQTAGEVATVLGLPITVEPLVRERGAFVCDVGTAREQSSPGTGRVSPSAPSTNTGGRETESDDSVAVRGRAFRAAARAWPELGRGAGRNPLGFHPRPDRTVNQELRNPALRPLMTSGAGRPR